MKSKLFKEHQKEQAKELKETKEDFEEQSEEESSEVESGHTGVAGSAKSKLIVIIASAILITLVIYFIFFKGSQQSVKTENLEAIDPGASLKTPNAPTGEIAPEERIDEILGQIEDSDPELLKTPPLPDVPMLEIPKSDDFDEVLPNFLDEQQPNPGNQQPINPANNNQLQPQVNNNNQFQPQVIVQPPIDPRRSPIVVVSTGASSRINSSQIDHFSGGIVVLNADSINSLEETGESITPTIIRDRSTTILQGKLMNAVLETAINTEIPGSIRGIISRDVYGESGRNVLIPKGSRLFGTFSTQIVRGQGRVEISWTRLIRPDGVDLAIQFIGSDQFGRAGIAGDIDNRYGSVLANSLLTSVLAISGAIAAEKLTDDSSVTTTTSPETGTTTNTSSASAQVITDVTKTIVDAAGQLVTNAIDTRPVIRVPQGTRITVVVNADMRIPKLRE
jgi:type IV secretion system protein VirB10